MTWAFRSLQSQVHTEQNQNRDSVRGLIVLSQSDRCGYVRIQDVLDQVRFRTIKEKDDWIVFRAVGVANKSLHKVFEDSPVDPTCQGMCRYEKENVRNKTKMNPKTQSTAAPLSWAA
jgi:hypothetical protein